MSFSSALTKTPAFRPAAARAGRERPQAAVAAFGNFGRCPFAGKSRSTLSPPSAAPSPTAADPTSLFARLGGPDPVYAVTSGLFDRLLRDETLGHFFEEATLPKHKAIVASFLNGALGGPSQYKGRSMFDAHIGLVDLEHPRDFNIVAGHLDAVLKEAGVPSDLAGEVMSAVGGLEPDFAKIARARKLIAEMD